MQTDYYTRDSPVESARKLSNFIRSDVIRFQQIFDLLPIIQNLIRIINSDLARFHNTTDELKQATHNSIKINKLITKFENRISLFIKMSKSVSNKNILASIHPWIERHQIKYDEQREWN